MTNKHVGWTLAAASLGMMLLLISADIKQLGSFEEVWTPTFIGSSMAHLGNVIMAFIGGKLIPTEPISREEDKILRRLNDEKD